MATDSARSALAAKHQNPENPPPGDVVTMSKLIAVAGDCGNSVSEMNASNGSSTNWQPRPARMPRKPLAVVNFERSSWASHEPAMPPIRRKSSAFESNPIAVMCITERSVQGGVPNFRVGKPVRCSLGIAHCTVVPFKCGSVQPAGLTGRSSRQSGWTDGAARDAGHGVRASCRWAVPDASLTRVSAQPVVSFMCYAMRHLPVLEART